MPKKEQQPCPAQRAPPLSTLFDVLSALGLELVIGERSKTSKADIERLF